MNVVLICFSYAHWLLPYHVIIICAASGNRDCLTQHLPGANNSPFKKVSNRNETNKLRGCCMQDFYSH